LAAGFAEEPAVAVFAATAFVDIGFVGTALAEPAVFASDLPPAAALAATFAGSFFVAK
jgi:hypothetical protein